MTPGLRRWEWGGGGPRGPRAPERAWDELTAASHCELLLLLCSGSGVTSQGVSPRAAACVRRVASPLIPKVSIHPYCLNEKENWIQMEL
ncbi:hypothetical protein T07_9257 [Trichinella nelsoni]|uniref:Uncharacterized protein n=1 Tax=Trichinella nelsoni TaxID=6336 RepID=A0A0V0RBX4_9BILA|nr:hypothetical protein T07_9257 [Trichinella nelsoni]